MTDKPDDTVLSWAAAAIGGGVQIRTVEALVDQVGPWHLQASDGQDLVLRMTVPGWTGSPQLATHAAALRLAERHGLAAPRLVASDLDGHDAGVVATLETMPAGTSSSPASVSVERLRAAGAAIARVHAIPLQPSGDLPLRIRHTQVDDRPMERRWATLYSASAAADRPAVIDGLCELTGWSVDQAREVAAGFPSTPLLQLAEDRVRGLPRPDRQSVFLHGDIWAGNMLWEHDTCTALIDWRCAGVGDPGVDLGQLRMQMAFQYGLDAADPVLSGWEQESGRAATDLAYWDVVATIQAPTRLIGLPGFDERGRRLDEPAVTARRDVFLRSALDRLSS